jgi:hypothetical protein
LTIEKRCGLKVVAFDRSPFKLFTLRVSNKSVQAPSCERPITPARMKSLMKRKEEKINDFLTNRRAPSCERPKTTQRNLFLLFANNNCFPITVYRRSFIKKSVKLACHVVNSNIAIGALPTLQISLRIVALFEKIYDDEQILTLFSNIAEDVQYRYFN